MASTDKKLSSKRTRSVSQADENSAKKQGKKTPIQVGLVCTTCSIHVGDEDSLPCDFCGRYTHLSCDQDMNRDLYDALNKHQPNPLLYFCIECKPMLVPKQSKNLWAGFLERVSKCIESDKGYEPLATKIMDRMSLKIEHLDDLVREHNRSFENSREELNQMLSTYRDNMCDTRNTLDTAVHNHNNSLMSSSAALAKTKAALSEVSTEITNRLNQIQTNNQQPPMPPIPPPQTNRPPPPPPLITPHQYAHVAAPGAQNYGGLRPMLYNGPPMQNRPPPSKPTPDPETTLVVYNADYRNIRIAVEDLMLKCNIYQYEVKYADVLTKTNDNRQSKPIFIRCDQARTKWNFIRDINKLRQTSPAYKDIYARPFLSNEDLRADRNLYRKLIDIRKRHSDRTFKIYKGDIYEKTDETFDVYVEPITDDRDDNTDNAQEDPEMPPLEGEDGQQNVANTPVESNDA